MTFHKVPLSLRVDSLETPLFGRVGVKTSARVSHPGSTEFLFGFTPIITIGFTLDGVGGRSFLQSSSFGFGPDR